jgi:hypothetical protein
MQLELAVHWTWQGGNVAELLRLGLIEPAARTARGDVTAYQLTHAARILLAR